MKDATVKNYGSVGGSACVFIIDCKVFIQACHGRLGLHLFMVITVIANPKLIRRWETQF